MPREKGGRLWVKAWGEQSWFFLVDCCTWGANPGPRSAYSACWCGHSSGSEPCHWKISLPLQELNFVRKEVKVIMEDPRNWCSRNASFLWEKSCWYSGGFLEEFSQILNILRNYGWKMLTILAFVGICHTFCLPKFGQETLNCFSIRYIVPAKISPALMLCQKNWFFGKTCLINFYPLLRSIASSWIHIVFKRTS